MTLATRAWHGLDGFSAEAEAWNECATRLDPLCDSHAWTLSHARAFTPERDVFGFTCLDADGRPAAVLALRREPARGAFALRRATFLADGSFDSDYLEPPLRAGLEREVAGTLLDAARSVRGLEALVLACVPEDSPFLAALRAELEQRGLARREHGVPCLITALPGSLPEFIASLKSRMRSKVRSALRASSEAGARFAWCTQDLERHMQELFRLHELRWRAEGHAGSFADPRRRAFYLDLCRSHLARGTLRLARLERDGQTLAYQFGLLAGGRYYQIQEGYDPAHEEQRVGIALRALAIESLIAEGVRAYDFMAGDSRHKRDWGATLRACTTVAFPLERWRARLTYGLRAWVDRRKKRAGAAETRREEDSARSLSFEANGQPQGDAALFPGGP